MSIRNDEVTASLEDYLEAIYFLHKKNAGVRLTDVAGQLGISKPSVNRAINTLKEMGFVEHEHYGDLSLTVSGIKRAEEVASRHELIKTFLVDILGVDDAIGEEDACGIEHTLSYMTFEKLRDFVNKNK